MLTVSLHQSCWDQWNWLDRRGPSGTEWVIRAPICRARVELESGPSLLAPGPVLLLEFTATVQAATSPPATFERTGRRRSILLAGGSWLDFSLINSLDHAGMDLHEGTTRDHTRGMIYCPLFPSQDCTHHHRPLSWRDVGGCGLASLILQTFPRMFCLGWEEVFYPSGSQPPSLP